MTEGAHASPNPLLTQKHAWQSVTGDPFILIDVLEENSLAPLTPGLVVLGWGCMGLHVALESVIRLLVCFQPIWADEVISGQEMTETALRIVADVAENGSLLR